MILLFLMSPYFYTAAQSNVQNLQPMEHGSIQHHGSSAVVFDRSPRPLLHAVRAVAEEYGWIVDFEDPPYYSKVDLLDDTDADWRAANPNSPGATRVAGGEFRSEFPELSRLTGGTEQTVLQKVVDDYNATKNPGRFELIKNSDGTFVVVGVQVADELGNGETTKPILDTQITLPSQTRSGWDTLSAILQAIHAATGKKVAYVGISNNLFINSKMTVGGTDVAARSLLASTVSQLGTPFVLFWNLLYDHDTDMYLLNIEPAFIVQDNLFGTSKRAPLLRKYLQPAASQTR